MFLHFFGLHAMMVIVQGKLKATITIEYIHQRPNH